MTSAKRSGVIPELSANLRMEIARRHVGMNQAQLAEALGVSTGTIQRAERGEKVRRSTVLAWAMVTGVDLDWLETGKAPSPVGDGASDAPPAGLEPATVRLTVGSSAN
jgi:DNA-binding XRE family transcriptional regulator